MVNVPLPKRMRGLQKDRRGYPIPFNVLLDTDNNPHFTINDERRQWKCLLEKRCPICGNKLDKKLWFVGGPLSAFVENGWYMDLRLHQECMTYALQVCPYLSAPKYLTRIDAVKLDPAKMPHGYPPICLDATQIPERPPLFVAVCSLGQETSERGRELGLKVTPYVRPMRPYVAVEYWRCGVRLPDREGAELAVDYMEQFYEQEDVNALLR